MKKESLNLIRAIDQIAEATKDQAFRDESIKNAKEGIKVVAKRLHLTPNQCILFSGFINQFDDRQITPHDLARFYGCTQIKILAFWDDIEHLCSKKYINKFQEDNGEIYFRVPKDMMDALCKNQVFTPKTFTNLNIEQFCDRLSELLRSRNDGGISFELLLSEIQDLLQSNTHLDLVSKIYDLALDCEDLILFLCIMNLYIQNGDNHVIRHDFEDIFPSIGSARRLARQLERGDHFLQEVGLIEYSNSDGMVETNAWQLTDIVKDEFLAELKISENADNDKTLMAANSISEKKLFFNTSISKQLDQLANLLQEEQFVKVQERLVKNGMRKGFACIFYGAPGTGKTETVLQLARQTGRSIMMVDVPNLRSKWVGDTEKNTKAIFDKYRRYCKKNKLAPILLFNEADAVLCKRNEGATGSVDKMENAMQNIILQEMETLDGIMIATTNLTGNLDTAFERRFLYKIEFPKPTPNESKHIWHTMLPDISEDEAYDLAKAYSFSGGQIENIARKQIVNSILCGDDKIQLNRIREACDTELFKGKGHKIIGFA